LEMKNEMYSANKNTIKIKIYPQEDAKEFSPEGTRKSMQ